MSEPQTPAALARRYLDLWDRQARAMASEPDWAAVMQQWVSAQERGNDQVGSDPSGNDQCRDDRPTHANGSDGGD